MRLILILRSCALHNINNKFIFWPVDSLVLLEILEAFCKCFEGDKIFVLWEWYWIEDSSIASSVSNSPMPSDDNSSSSDDDNSVPAITHSVIFKCMGVTKEKWYQDTLKYAKQQLDNGIQLPLKLQPEPDNKCDSKAIAFMCQDNLGWLRIGYVLHELTNEVHGAINNGKILNVAFDWIKCCVPNLCGLCGFERSMWYHHPEPVLDGPVMM